MSCGPWGSGLGVYPRVCGGTRGEDKEECNERGLSPRVRGNQCHRVRDYTMIGSIPACAGEPPLGFGSIGGRAVYPRVCGGTSERTRRQYSPWGLSPRVRGNPGNKPLTAASPRSIPACAGEPIRAARGHTHGRVYPRVCGGTGSAPFHAQSHRGLSPRVRGNPLETLSISLH